jgi:Cu(I)/Ag(I) efflux system membrane protein CusA/SilA
MAETEYMVRSRGFLRSLDGLPGDPALVSGTTAVMLKDVAFLQIGPEMRRGIAELNGEGEVAGGVVGDALGQETRRTTIEAVKAKLER